jgi:TPR repeat protein
MGRAAVSVSDTADAWRVAALTMMPPAELRALLSGPEAAEWIKAAAACGLPEAQVTLGRMLLDGQRVPRDEAAAFALFKAAAESGDLDAINMVGRCHEGGWGTPQDFARAAASYARAADAGLAWAQYNLGHLLLDGNGVPRDRNSAFDCYMRAAAQGHERAMNLVARCYEEGWGVARNAQAARDWYRRSAEDGYFRGAYNYATLLAAEGDVSGAVSWFCCALGTAPATTRENIVAALARHPLAPVRALIAV